MKIRFYDSEVVSAEINRIEGNVKYFDRMGDDVIFRCDDGSVAKEGDWIYWNEVGSYAVSNEEHRAKKIRSEPGVH